MLVTSGSYNAHVTYLIKDFITFALYSNNPPNPRSYFGVPKAPWLSSYK